MCKAHRMKKNLFLFLILSASFYAVAQSISCQSAKRPASLNAMQTAPANLRSDTIDVLDEDVHLDMTDFTTDTIRGYTVVKFTPKINGQSHITLDLLTMRIDSVTAVGQVLSYSYNDTILVAGLPALYNTTDTLSVKVCYHGVPKADPSGWGGFSFSAGYAYNLGVGFSPNFHSFGRCWFPCFDNFAEKCTYTFNIVSPPGKRAVCNGQLLKDSTSGNNYRTWQLDKPITSYLASVAVNNYVFVNKTFPGLLGNVPVMLAALPGDTTNLKNSFVNLQGAFNCFESHYGPYVWPRVGYVLVPFSNGAMEHASNIAYPRVAANGTLTYEDQIMAHELSHHWWGDLLTCETAQEMYINEGFASYNQLLFNECVYGPTKYFSKAMDNHDDALHNAHFSDKGFHALSNVPLSYTYGDHSYIKGADLIYTLRNYMGDSLFFDGMKYVLQQRSYKNLNSTQFDTLLTHHTGYNTNPYFSGWINSPGWPHFSIDSMQVNGNNVTVFVRQRLFGAPSFYQNVPLDVLFMDANRTQVVKRINVSGQFSNFSFSLPFSPVYAGINHNNRISDAITSQYKNIFQTGNITYTYGRAVVGVYTNGPDSSFLRIEHNFVKPDPIKNNVNNYRLGIEHYWKVDGVLSNGFRSSLKLYFNGKKNINHTPGSTEYLDTSLTQFTADSLIVLYRKNTADDWHEVHAYTKVKIGNSASVYGYVTIDTLKLGEYCFANGHSSVIGINEEARQQRILIYPNPANDKVTIDVSDKGNMAEQLLCRLYSADGRKVLEQFIQPGSELDVSSLAKGYYTLKVEGKGISYSHKLVINPK